MAESKNNPLTRGASGMYGGVIVFRTWNGKTFMSSRPKKPTKESPFQKDTRTTFRRATAFAKSMMIDPAKKAEYQEIANRLNLPNAYTAAITEYMRKPEISEVEVGGYSENTGEEVRLTIRKKDFEVQEVEVAIQDKDGRVIEEGKAIKGLANRWTYKLKASIEERTFVLVVVRVGKRKNNFIEKKFHIVR